MTIKELLIGLRDMYLDHIEGTTAHEFVFWDQMYNAAATIVDALEREEKTGSPVPPADPDDLRSAANIISRRNPLKYWLKRFQSFQEQNAHYGWSHDRAVEIFFEANGIL